ncbi:MAG: hypothetical protein IJ562_04725 [Prevotella sp.]|nr:hypothetical protein [Prevotella sp.]
MPIVTDTYIGSPDRPPQLDYNPNGMEYFTSPFRSYPTARTARVTVPYPFNNKLTVKLK